MKHDFISNYMQEAIALAQKGTELVHPNPLVGAVIVKDGKIIGRGWHKCFGGLHAERNAILDAGPEHCCGADLYVTLEPCCHTGKQPPCTEAIITAGISRVFVGSSDPNPLVNGKGIMALEAAGIAVIRDVLRQKCDALNPVFFHYITTKTPYVIMKYAMTADGLTACSTGNSRWISSNESRMFVHKLRARYMAVMVGIGTVLLDDPLLTCRLHDSEYHVREPLRIVCDSRLRIPIESRLVQTAKDVPLVIACALSEAEYSSSRKASILEQAGVKLICVPGTDGRVDLGILMKKLGEQHIDSIVLEGGSRLNYSALEAGIVRKLQIFVAPKLFGSGNRARTPVCGPGADNPADAIFLGKPDIRMFGEDVLLEYAVKNRRKSDVYRDC